MSLTGPLALLFVSLPLVTAACDRANAPPTDEARLYTVEFAQFSDAHEARLKLHAEGAEVSDRPRFVDGAWTFISSLPYEPAPTAPEGECDSTGQGPWGPGTTACDLRTDAETQRAALIRAGWECGPIHVNTGRYEFSWVKRGDG